MVTPDRIRLTGLLNESLASAGLSYFWDPADAGSSIESPLRQGSFIL
jgi:hypothetical protein